MKKSEERALEAYPYSKGKVIATGFGTIEFDQNHDERVGFIAGYEQALSDVKTEILAYIETQQGGFKELLQFIEINK